MLFIVLVLFGLAPWRLSLLTPHACEMNLPTHPPNGTLLLG